MAVTELSCQELVEIVTDYLEEKLTPEERRRVEEHLAACEGCRNYLEQMRDTIRLSGRLDERSIPVPMREQLLRAFRDWKAS
jgi:predicted anti-sigma-YlaC factor YlaD